MLDEALDDDILDSIKTILDSNKDIQSYHDLKTRQSGETYFVEVHLVFNPDISLLKAHDIADTIENSIKALRANGFIIINYTLTIDEKNNK